MNFVVDVLIVTLSLLFVNTFLEIFYRGRVKNVSILLTILLPTDRAL